MSLYDRGKPGGRFQYLPKVLRAIWSPSTIPASIIENDFNGRPHALTLDYKINCDTSDEYRLSDVVTEFTEQLGNPIFRLNSAAAQICPFRR
jgi:hypothetical protein